MMTDDAYFFDSYAIIEILGGSTSYAKYKDSGIIITKLNLFEIFYYLLRISFESQADKFFGYYRMFVQDYDEEVIKEAARIKLKYKKRKLSMTDCIGYTLATTYGIKFLTGDKGFEDLENVEFVQ